MTETFDQPSPYLVQPGILIRTRVNLGQQDREIGFEASIDRDAPQNEIDDLCDKMVAAGDRLRAKTLLPDYRRGRENAEYKHNGNRHRKVTLESRLIESRRIREEKRREIETRLAQAVAGWRAEHEATGRRVAFRPTPQQTRPYQADLDALADGERKEMAEAEVQFAQLATELDEGQRALDQWDGLIADAEALLRE